MKSILIKILLVVSFNISIFILISCNKNRINEINKIENQLTILKGNASKYKLTYLDSFYRVLAEQSHHEQFKNGEILALNELANLFFENGKYDSAIQYNLYVLELRKGEKDTLNIINSYINIANCYANLKQNINQKKYLNLLKPIINRSKDTINFIRYYTSLGIYYSSTNSNDNAKIELQKAIKLSEVEETEDYLSIALLNYGNILIQEDNDSALIYMKKCEVIFKNKQNYKALIGVYNNLAESYWIINEPAQIIESLNKGYFLLAKYGSPLDWQNILFNMAYYYEEQGDYEKSLVFYQKLDSIKTAFFNESMSASISNIEKDYTVKLKTEENAKLNAELKRKNTLRNASLIGVVLLSLLGFYQYRNYKQKRKLIENEKQIKDQEIDQLLKEKELKNMDALFEGREEERKRIGRDLHDRLGSMLSTVKLHFSAIEARIDDLQNDNQNQYSKATALLDEAVGEVRKIAHDLVSGTLVHQGLVAALIELKQSIESTGSLSVNVFNKMQSTPIDIENEISIYRIIQELVSNVIKHADAKKVDIHLNRIADELNIIVEDNGKGFDSNQKDMLGIGLANIKQRAAKLGATIHFDSTVGKGTTVILEIDNVSKLRSN